MQFAIAPAKWGKFAAEVVSAVFVQQTMKMANSDEELAFRQKEKEHHGTILWRQFWGVHQSFATLGCHIGPLLKVTELIELLTCLETERNLCCVSYAGSVAEDRKLCSQGSQIVPAHG